MATAEIHNLSGILEKIEHRLEQDAPGAAETRLSLGDLLEIIGHRSYGPLLVVIGLASISPLALIPGSTWAFAILTLLIAAQMAFNRKHPWLPPSALKMSFPERDILKAMKRARPWTNAVDKVIQPRLQFLAGEPWIALIALLAIAAALITFPLSFIPFAPFLPGATITLIGLGVTARDGVVLGISILFMAATGLWLTSRWL